MVDVLLRPEPSQPQSARDHDSSAVTSPAPARRGPRPGWILVAASASVAAGLVHGAVVGVHGDDRTLVWMFSLAALVQVGVGLSLFARPSRSLAVVAALANAGCVTVWALSRTTGISFVTSLKQSEPVGLTDGLCALLGAIAVIAALGSLGRRRSVAFPAVGALTLPVMVAMSLLTLPALIAAPAHSHAGGAAGHVHPGTTASTGSTASAAAQAAAPVPTALPKPFDPTQPIDLSGTPGVTPEEQQRAEALLEVTLKKLPQFADPAVAIAAGYHPIGDAMTGHEHFIKWDLINDNDWYDPDHPESLVYRNRNGVRTLEAAMYLLPDTIPLDKVPDLGGSLTQFHIHDNLCFTDDPVAPQLTGLTNGDGTCSYGKKFPNAPMVHVWIKPNVCGPFAALEGVGAGQVQTGETRSCDHSHGSAVSF